MSQRESGRPLQRKRMAYFRARLIEQRRRLLDALDRGKDGHHVGVNRRGDEYDAANDSSERETLYGITAIELTHLKEIERALRKIDDGTYGRCERCGVQIPAGRLKVMPFAALCVACKEQEERTNPFSLAHDQEGAWARVEDSAEEAPDFDRAVDPASHRD